MKFGKEILEEAREEWKDKYINYLALKRKLQEVKDEVFNPHANPAVLEAKRAIFQGHLDSEIEKVVLWYKSCLDSMGQNVVTLERDLAMAPQVLEDVSIDSDFKLRGLGTLRSRWRKLITELASLLEYVSLNMTAMRKILKKYAKHVEPTKPMEGYCTLEVQHPDDPSWAFVQGTFLPDYVAQELDLMQNDPAVADIQERARVALGYINMIRKELVKAVPEPGQNCKVSVQVPPLFAPQSSRGSRKHPPARLLTRRDTEQHTSAEEDDILHQIDVAAHQALVTSRLVRSRPWSIMQAGIFEDPPGDMAASGDRAGLWITLVMAFLHAAVYFLPTPDMHNLCRGLGVDLSLSALIFAVADIGEVFASFVFTYWTNTNYRHPLLFGAACGALGCILTSAAFVVPQPMGWSVMLIGRFLIGSAASRTICRRYIADCISLQERTQASLGMVVANNLGMAVGFLSAIPIRRVLVRLDDTGDVGQQEPVEIMGWLGGVVWTAALVAAFFLFRDPHKGPDQPSSDLEAPLNPDGQPGTPTREGTAPSMPKSPTQAALMLSQTSWGGHEADGAGDGREEDWSEASVTAGGESSHGASARRAAEKPPFLRNIIHYAISNPNVPWEEIQEALVPTMCCFVCLAAARTALAVFSTSLTLFSHGSLWYWKEYNRSLLLGAVTFTMLPAGYLAARMSMNVSDRKMLSFAIAFTVFACCCLYQLGASGIRKGLYISGAVLLHMSVVGVEGSSMSLISKVIHPSMARGPVNTGLLTTVAGTGGRFLGNILVLGLASFITVDQSSPEFELVQFAHLLYGTLSLLFCCCLLYALGLYRHLK